MDSKHLKRYSTLVIKDMQVKTIMRYNYVFIKMAKFIKNYLTKDVEELERSYCWWGSKVVQPLWKTVWQYLKKLNVH